LQDDRAFTTDLQSLSDCSEFQKKTGKCDMKTFLAFIEEQRETRLGNRKDKDRQGKKAIVGARRKNYG
jgi:hypothetical protein